MSSRNPVIELQWTGELKRPSGGRFLIHNVLPRRGLAVLWGEPKSGKTFLILDMAYHIATGKKWRGLATKQGPVVYGCFEGQDGLYYRVHALKHALNRGDEFSMATRQKA